MFKINLGVPVHDVKACKEEEVSCSHSQLQHSVPISDHIRASACLTPGDITLVTIVQGMGGPQSLSGPCGKVKHLLSPSGTEPRVLVRPF